MPRRPLEEFQCCAAQRNHLRPRLAVAQPRAAPLEVHLRPGELEDLAPPAAGEGEEPQAVDRRRMRATVLFRLVDRGRAAPTPRSTGNAPLVARGSSGRGFDSTASHSPSLSPATTSAPLPKHLPSPRRPQPFPLHLPRRHPEHPRRDLPATRSAAAPNGSSAKCAYRAVVAGDLCPSNRPITGSPSPAAAPKEASVCRRSCNRTSSSPAAFRTRSHTRCNP